MENEFSIAARQGVVLIVVAFIIISSWLAVVSGQVINRSSTRIITNSTSYIYAAELESIMSYHEDLPTASVYVALAKNRDAITTIEGSAYGVDIDDIEDLTQLFDHQIYCDIERDNEAYKIEIRE